MAVVLLVGTDRERVSGLRRLLRQDGHQIVWHRSIVGWRDRESEVRPDIVVTTADTARSVLSGKGRAGSTFLPPLLIVEEDSGFGRDLHVDERLVDGISSPFMAEELLARVDALTRVRRVVHHKPADEENEPVPGWRGLGRRLSALFGVGVPRSEKPREPYLEVASRVAEWTDRRDVFAPGHAERVTSFCAMMAQGLELDRAETAPLLRAAALHDIGKVGLPAEILHQRTPLEESQRRLIRTHPQRGATLLRALDPDERVAATVLYHHECPDGSGYYGKKRANTPLTARILAVAEVFDAMTTTQLTDPLPRDQALDRMRERSGTVFDQDCVEALVERLRSNAEVIPLSVAPRPAPSDR